MTLVPRRSKVRFAPTLFFIEESHPPAPLRFHYEFSPEKRLCFDRFVCAVRSQESRESFREGIRSLDGHDIISVSGESSRAAGKEERSALTSLFAAEAVLRCRKSVANRDTANQFEFAGSAQQMPPEQGPLKEGFETGLAAGCIFGKTVCCGVGLEAFG